MGGWTLAHDSSAGRPRQATRLLVPSRRPGRHPARPRADGVQRGLRGLRPRDLPRRLVPPVRLLHRGCDPTPAARPALDLVSGTRRHPSARCARAESPAVLLVASAVVRTAHRPTGPALPPGPTPWRDRTPPRRRPSRRFRTCLRWCRPSRWHRRWHRPWSQLFRRCRHCSRSLQRHRGPPKDDRRWRPTGRAALDPGASAQQRLPAASHATTTTHRGTEPTQRHWRWHSQLSHRRDCARR